MFHKVSSQALALAFHEKLFSMLMLSGSIFFESLPDHLGCDTEMMFVAMLVASDPDAVLARMRKLSADLGVSPLSIRLLSSH